ncbi:hypothetical protein LRS11_21455 [Pseudomonas sp. J452]|uniref:hypothetical protein n=1 Tax=Pseudomonas sp. J452 TaxID=2898441 RepID=UPI0021ADC3D2|nr:hypothetical protein [Pseudomonas sp. J452]UUY08328.1 hypothetical protein LRS11_21455 [Pseudomonas sp. J452]
MRWLCGALAACLVEPVLGLGREVGYAEAAGHFASLQELQHCGEWQLGERAVALRLLRFSLYGQDLLFVDLLQPAADGTHLQVERGFGFIEFNNDHAEMSLAQLRCSSDGKTGVHISGIAENGHDGSRQRFQINLDGRSGAYRYQASPSE